MTTVDARVWELRMPAPSGWISANDRRRSIAQAGKVSVWRGAATVWARKTQLPKGLEHVHVTATIRHTASYYDVGNLYPTVKAAVDGLVDYGLIPDDDNSHLTGPDLRKGERWPKPRFGHGGELLLTITEVARPTDVVVQDAEARGYQRAIDDLLAVPSHETHVAADWLEARRDGRDPTFSPAEPDYVWGVRYRSPLLANHIILACDEDQARRKVRFHRGQATATLVRAPRGEWEEVPDA